MFVFQSPPVDSAVFLRGMTRRFDHQGSRVLGQPIPDRADDLWIVLFQRDIQTISNRPARVSGVQIGPTLARTIKTVGRRNGFYGTGINVLSHVIQLPEHQVISILMRDIPIENLDRLR